MPERAEREQVLAFRLAGHHLHRRTDPLTAIAACGLQDTPPGWADIALHARSTRQPDPADVLVVQAMRGAPYLVPRRDLAVFTTALVGHDEPALRALVGTQVRRDLGAIGMDVRKALDRVAAATREALAEGPLGRDDFHQALRERLPEELLPWCRGCQSHHVRPSLWRAMGALGVTQRPARATLALAPGAPRVPDPGKELVRRFLRCFGPATHTHFAGWAQQSTARAKAMVQALGDELAEVRVGPQKRYILAEDERRLAAPPAARGVRLLGGWDPYADQRDRELIAPDEALRKRIFRATARLGLVLVDGELRGLWKATKKGDVLTMEVEWLGDEADLGREPAAIAALRGCAEVRVSRS
jgi:hypothetical protein